MNSCIQPLRITLNILRQLDICTTNEHRLLYSSFTIQLLSGPFNILYWVLEGSHNFLQSLFTNTVHLIVHIIGVLVSLGWELSALRNVITAASNVNALFTYRAQFCRVVNFLLLGTANYPHPLWCRNLVTAGVLPRGFRVSASRDYSKLIQSTQLYLPSRK